MITMGPADQVLTGEALVDAIVDVLGQFLRSTEALNRAIDSSNAVLMCAALESLGEARDMALRLVGR